MSDLHDLVPGEMYEVTVHDSVGGHTFVARFDRLRYLPSGTIDAAVFDDLVLFAEAWGSWTARKVQALAP